MNRSNPPQSNTSCTDTRSRRHYWKAGGVPRGSPLQGPPSPFHFRGMVTRGRERKGNSWPLRSHTVTKSHVDTSTALFLFCSHSLLQNLIKTRKKQTKWSPSLVLQCFSENIAKFKVRFSNRNNKNKQQQQNQNKKPNPEPVPDCGISKSNFLPPLQQHALFPDVANAGREAAHRPS